MSVIQTISTIVAVSALILMVVILKARAMFNNLKKAKTVKDDQIW